MGTPPYFIMDFSRSAHVKRFLMYIDYIKTHFDYTETKSHSQHSLTIKR